MANTVKERVLVFFFRPIRDEMLETLRNAFEAFAKSNFGEVGFVNTRINRPTISKPKCTEGEVEPDWTKLKVGVSRLYRYVTSNGCFMFQIANEFFSFNSLDGGDESNGARSCDELLSFIASIKVFVLDVLSRRVKIVNAHYDMIYCAKQNDLGTFLEQPQPNGSYAYYNVFKLFRNLGDGSTKDAWGFVSPLEQHFKFDKRNDEHLREVEMDVKAGLNSRKEWCLEVKTMCYAHHLDAIEDASRKLEYMFKMVPEFDGCQGELLGRVFSPSAMKTLGFGK